MRLTLPLDKIKVNLPIMSNRIWVWDKLDGDHMLNEDDKEKFDISVMKIINECNNKNEKCRIFHG